MQNARFLYWLSIRYPVFTEAATGRKPARLVPSLQLLISQFLPRQPMLVVAEGVLSYYNSAVRALHGPSF